MDKDTIKRLIIEYQQFVANITLIEREIHLSHQLNYVFVGLRRAGKMCIRDRYIPRGARRISIMHDKFGVLRNYFYPDIIEKATVYEMEIQIGDGTQQTPTNTNTQLIVMRPDPATANIYIDDEKVPTENGLFTATMKKGTHTYRVESPMYAPEAGVIDCLLYTSRCV